MFTCKHNDGFQTDSEQGFKSHMSKSHGGFTLDDLKEQGITPSTRDIARSLAGNTSAREVTEQAPDSEPRPGDSSQPKTRTRRPRAGEVDPEVEKAKQAILRLRCKRMATLPYSLLAGMLGDESIKLSEVEAEELTQAYVTLATAYGWEGTSKLIIWGDVMICHAAIIGQKERKEAIMKAVGVGQEPKPNPETEGVPVEEAA